MSSISARTEALRAPGCAEKASERRIALLKRLGLWNGSEAAMDRGVFPKRESRRLGLLKRMGLFADSANVQVTRAITCEELCEAYRVVHDIFVREKYILPQECEMRIRAFEALPETATFVALFQDHVVGVQSLVLDHPRLGLPSDESFRQELDGIRGPGRRICEATSEAVEDAFRRSAVPTELMRCMFAQALAAGCHELITTVSPGHAKFYALLGFQQISDVRSYSKELNDPVVVLRMRLDAMSQRVAEIVSRGDADDEAFLKTYYIDENPYFSFIEEWEEKARAAFLDFNFLCGLLLEHGNVLERFQEDELAAIRSAWGDDLFQTVLAHKSASSGSAAVRTRLQPMGKWRISRVSPGPLASPPAAPDDVMARKAAS
jgi:hypothetical protein